MASHPFQLILERYKKGYRQEQECSCGPSSLALVCYSLGLGDKSESAWYDPRMRPWVPVDDFPSRGMALHEAQFTTQYIFEKNMEILLVRAFRENKTLFFKHLSEARKGKVGIVINFSQDHLLGETEDTEGHPHYSPVAGYDEKKEKILIADVDREMSGPYECSTDLVFESMEFENQSLRTPRGWLVLRKRSSLV